MNCVRFVIQNDLFSTLDFAPSTFFVRLRIASIQIIIDKTYSSFVLIVMKSFILFLGFAIVALTYAQQRDDCLDCVSDVVDAMEFCQVPYLQFIQYFI